MSESGYRVLVHTKTGFFEHPLREGTEISFGRAPECTVQLSDASASRRHALVRLLGGDLELVDLGSRNGSFVDGVRVPTHAACRVRASSVVRIAGAVLVFEAERATRWKQWCFDRAVFEQEAETLLAEARARGHRAGLVELRWGTVPSGATTAEQAPPAALEHVLARIVGVEGLIGAYDGRRLLLFLPQTDVDHLEYCAGLIRRICDESRVPVELRTASSVEAKTIHALAEEARGRGGSLVPPVIFQGALGSIGALLAKLEASDSPVLIVGETGVGKDVLAREVHARSRRASRPFVALNCAAFADALFESELFGHERGAFTGAAQTKMGLLESAEGGTVFLDEIGEMTLGMQAKMLRVIETREVFRVGAVAPRVIDVRFLFATNRDLHREIEAKQFRSDLFFRVSPITFTIPPLRKRIDEIVPLAEHFIARSSERLARRAPRLMPEAKCFLEGHAWPGNVRELKNVIDLAVVVCEDEWLRPSDIHIGRYVPLDADAVCGAATGIDTAPPISGANARTRPADKGEKTERERILDALERSAWNQSAAAKLLGMPRRTLVKRLAQYDLPRPRKRGAS